MRARTLLGALAAVLSAAAHAGESGDAAAGPQFRIAAGAEVTSEQSLYVQGGAVVTVLPGVYALWGRVYVRGPALGVYLLGGGDWTVSTGIFLELEDADRGDSPRLADMAELKDGLLGELVASYDTGWGELDFRAAADISGRHDGYLAGLAYGYPLAVGRWEVEPSVGVEWRSAEINRYHFGVSAADALPTRPLYRPDAGVSFEFGVSATCSFAESHSLQLTAGIESFGNEVADSPIVERSSRGKVGIGYLYRF